MTPKRKIHWMIVTFMVCMSVRTSQAIMVEPLNPNVQKSSLEGAWISTTFDFKSNMGQVLFLTHESDEIFNISGLEESTSWQAKCHWKDSERRSLKCAGNIMQRVPERLEFSYESEINIIGDNESLVERWQSFNADIKREGEVKFRPLIVTKDVAPMIAKDKADAMSAVPASERIQHVEQPVTAIDPLASTDDIAIAINYFGLSILDQITSARPRENALVSPLSLASAFAVLAEGASGDTYTLLLKHLGLDGSGLQPADVGRLGELVVESDSRVSLVNANSVWLAKALPIEAAFSDAAKAKFNAEVKVVDFSAAETLGAINGWFLERTHGKIPELLTNIDPATQFLIGNALHFKSSWTSPFDPGKTINAVFHAPGGGVEVPMMHKLFTNASYQTNTENEAIRLPFGDGRFDMTLILPAQGKTVASQLALSSGRKLGSLGHLWLQTRVDVAMPRIEVAAGGSLTETLKAFGLADLFTNGNLSGISKKPLAVSEVAHKVLLTVDESGAEAASATAILGVRSAATLQEPIKFTLDRPFALMIRHVPSNTLIISGVINNPLAN